MNPTDHAIAVQGIERKMGAMSRRSELPRYDRHRSYEWNYDRAPDPVELSVPKLPGSWQFCGLPVESPLGVAAGPLLNGKWCLYYASLGFDVLTYKTVRTAERACYPQPNLVPVSCPSLCGGEASVDETSEMQGSWAVSFGMPSKSPATWREDVRWTREQLAPTKRLCVSVVGSVRDDWTIGDLADDYARCAAWAVESGADVVETNFSCPNVATCDGQLYQQPDDAALVARRVRAAIGAVPLVIKIGHLVARDDAADLISALAPHATALAMTNSIATRVRQPTGQRQFDGQVRGICGQAILDASILQVAMFHELIRARGSSLQLIGVGGASTAADVHHYLQAGAHAVHFASAAMVNPRVALEIRRDWLGERSSR